jgi:RimJ/RimL family protein N-acetyltransferase
MTTSRPRACGCDNGAQRISSTSRRSTPIPWSWFHAPVPHPAESDAFARQAEAEIAGRGWALWATELRDYGEFIGWVGLCVPSFEAHFTPCVEIDWRLKRVSWGRGFATEAARECVRFAFASLGLSEVVSFTVPARAP